MSSYSTLKPLLDSKTKKLTKAALDRSVKDLASSIGKGREVGRLKLSILDGRQRHSYAIDLNRGKHTVSTSPEGLSDLDITCDKATYVEMMTGALSPADAFLTGRLEARGSLGFAKRVYARAARGRLDDLADFGD